MNRTSRNPHDTQRTVAWLCALALLGSLTAAGAAPATESTLSTTLCGTLKNLVPDVRSSTPVGAQAQLVMALAEAYEANPTQLRQVKTEIDSVASTNCAAERDALLAALKTQSLSEALHSPE
jgi:hypothetical protein